MTLDELNDGSGEGPPTFRMITGVLFTTSEQTNRRLDIHNFTAIIPNSHTPSVGFTTITPPSFLRFGFEGQKQDHELT